MDVEFCEAFKVEKVTAVQTHITKGKSINCNHMSKGPKVRLRIPKLWLPQQYQQHQQKPRGVQMSI